MISLNSVRPFCWFHTYYLITTRYLINNTKISGVIILLSNRTLMPLKRTVYAGSQFFLLFKLGKSKDVLKYICLSFVSFLPLFYFYCIYYFGSLIFCCQYVANFIITDRELFDNFFLISNILFLINIYNYYEDNNCPKHD